MSLRHKVLLVLGATLLAAACSAPLAPDACDPITIGSSRCT